MTVETGAHDPGVESHMVDIEVIDEDVAAAYNLLGAQEAVVDAARERNDAEALFRQKAGRRPVDTEATHPAIVEAWNLITGRYNGPSS